MNEVGVESAKSAACCMSIGALVWELLLMMNRQPVSSLAAPPGEPRLIMSPFPFVVVVVVGSDDDTLLLTVLESPTCEMRLTQLQGI